MTPEGLRHEASGILLSPERPYKDTQLTAPAPPATVS